MTTTQRGLIVAGLIGGLLITAGPSEAGAAPRRKTITVRTTAQLVAALGSNRTIRVMSGTYVLTDAAGTGAGVITWSKQYDGKQLDVVNVKNLRIVGVGRSRPRLLARPRYAWVIRFLGSENVTLDNLVLGHTRSGYCQGGVVAFERSKKAKILRSELYGSGTYGVELKQVKGFVMDRSEIRDCSYGILVIKRSSGVTFKGSTFRGNKQFDQIEITRTRNVRFQRCTVTGNSAGRGSLISVDRQSNVILSGGTWSNNTFGTFINRKKRLKIIGAKLNKDLRGALTRADPRYNQIYRLVRYRKWIVLGTQAGIAFLDAKTGKVALLKKAFIASSLRVVGKHLWVGTYRHVYRFDGLRAKSYYTNSGARGHALVAGPKGQLFVRGRRGKVLRYDRRRNRFLPASPTWWPTFRAYDVVWQRSGAVWAINFLSYVARYANGLWAHYRRRGQQYRGRDPRRIYVSPAGRVWVVDFRSGFFSYDPARDAFTWDPTVSSKGSDMVVDRKRRRTWFLHYTQGLYLKQPNQRVLHINLSKLGYMRAVHLERKTGDLWVAGWNGLVRIRGKGRTFGQRRFVVR